MSTCTAFFVLFKEKPTEPRITDLEAVIRNRAPDMISTWLDEVGRLVPVEEADVYASVNEDGSLDYSDKHRSSPLLASTRLQDRLYELCPLMRVWRTDSPYGPAAQYVVTLLTLLAQGDVEQVWFGNEKFQEGVPIAAATEESALQLLEDFIRIGSAK